jgi:hypothetical protein
MTRAQANRVRDASGTARAKLVEEIRNNGSGYYHAPHAAYRIYKDGDKWKVQQGHNAAGADSFPDVESAVRMAEAMHTYHVQRQQRSGT